MLVKKCVREPVDVASDLKRISAMSSPSTESDEPAIFRRNTHFQLPTNGSVVIVRKKARFSTFAVVLLVDTSIKYID